MKVDKQYKKGFGNGIVFMVGGGSYYEYDTLKSLADQTKDKANKKQVNCSLSLIIYRLFMVLIISMLPITS